MPKLTSQRRGLRFGLNFAAVLLISTTLALAQEHAGAVTNAPPPKAPPWESTGAAGLTLTRGNTDTLLTTLSLDTKRKWDRNELAFGVAGGYGEDDEGKNAEFVNAFAQYNRLFSDRFYAGLRLDLKYDGIADLDYRLTVSPLVGYYLVKETNTTFAVEAGPSVIFEKYKSEDETTYLGFRLGERFEHKLTPTTRIWQSADHVPQVDKWAEKYIITAEAGIAVAINKRWSLRVVGQNIYDSQPASGRDRNDFRLIAGTEVKF
jgi:putative salt-induced outer membrane protein YdiY